MYNMPLTGKLRADARGKFAQEESTW